MFHNKDTNEEKNHGTIPKKDYIQVSRKDKTWFLLNKAYGS